MQQESCANLGSEALMLFQPFRLPPERWTFRGVSGSLKQNIPAAKEKAFLRKPKDDDGITVLPEPCLCCALKISGIGKIKVGDIESLSNPVTKEKLHVLQNEKDHAVIVNVPYHDDHPNEAQQLAKALAAMCTLLDEKEFEDAKREWATRFRTTSEGSEAEHFGSRPG
jgi:hypothetical protein